jgi:hypothetical protein
MAFACRCCDIQGWKTYSVETDAVCGFLVKVARPDGVVCLTSPRFRTLSDIRAWIDTHRLSVAGIVAAAEVA